MLALLEAPNDPLDQHGEARQTRSVDEHTALVDGTDHVNRWLGKCAPRLLEDLLRYDPRNAAVGARNVLIDPPAKLQHGGVLPVSVALGSCRHKYMIKPEQSKPPPYDSRPDSSTYYKIASYCSDCRCHLDLTVDFRTGSSDRPCPNEAFPLHHLRYDPAGSTPGLKSAKPQEGEDWVDQHQFVCSSPRCSAVVRISIRAPRLKADHVSLLTDPSKIKERVQREIDNSPERLKGFGIPEPIIVLQNLKQYLADALKAREKGFSADNKRYLTSLGEPCRPLLEYLGFKYEADAGNVRMLPPSSTLKTKGLTTGRSLVGLGRYHLYIRQQMVRLLRWL